MTFGPTLELLEKVHPQLPATFFNLFVGALNSWIRIYDYQRCRGTSRDAAGMGRAGSRTLTSTRSQTCRGRFHRACGRRHWMKVSLLTSRTRSTTHSQRNWWRLHSALDRVSAQAKRPELGDDIGQQLSDCNPPLPCLLAIFAEGDSVAACFDEEAQGMLEVTPEPNLIIPFDPTDTESVRDAFHVFGVACETIAAASRLIDLMPGNDKWVISR